MPGTAVFIFDSSYPSSEVALPIDDRRLHVVVSDRRIEPPPGHSCLQLERVRGFASLLGNLRLLRSVWTKAEGGTCVVISAPGVRPEQLLLNATYAIFLSRNILFFDGLDSRSMRHTWRKLLRAVILGPARYVLGGLRLRLKVALFAYKARAFAKYSTGEGRLFGLYTSTHTFSLPPDEVTLEADDSSLYGHSTGGWHMPAFSSRRQRYSVQTTRHVLRDVSLHVENVGGSAEPSLFQDGRILDYPYFLGRTRHQYCYPVSSRRASRTIERGINLLPYTSGYYHWLVEGVPRILDVIDDGISFDRYPLILPPLESYHRQVLALLGIIPDRQVITVAVGEWCHVGECIFPTANFPFGAAELEDPSGQPDQDLLLRIRNRLMERVALTIPMNVKTPNKIYISRAKAGWRKFTEETEIGVTALLESAGFERVCLEDLPWTTQIRMIAGSKFIVGLHGAGLANILFADAKALLEFHNPMETRPYFAVMARELGISYAYVIGSLKSNSPTFDDITIDLRVVGDTVQQMEAGL